LPEYHDHVDPSQVLKRLRILPPRKRLDVVISAPVVLEGRYITLHVEANSRV